MIATLIPALIRNRHPELFLPDANTDRHTCVREVPMQVLALGFSRTGTLSMCAALERLGYPTYHFFRIFTSVRDADMWMEAYESKYFSGQTILDRKFWDSLLGHVSAVTDTPAIAFVEELIAAYPEAKVILWQRDEQDWAKSYAFVLSQYGNRFAQLMAWLEPRWWGRIHRLIDRGLFQGTFSATSKDDLPGKSRRVYREHFLKARELLRDSPNRLLEYKMGDGWQPICQFLDKPLPNEPFPRLNETASLKVMRPLVFLRVVDQLKWRLLAAAVASLAVAVAWNR